ncbi:MAG: SCO family protein [Bacteroidia bacterium]|nr:SCO family protein [Bacteroidia bacterium]
MATASWKKILIPLIILIFPVVFWLVISSGTNHLKRLPILGPVEISEKGDTLFHTIAHFSMTNQDNRQITSNDLNGKIYVASFFFATCPDVCPKMNRQMERVQDAFRGSGEVRLLSFTVNPEHDSVSVLKD